MLVAPDHPDAPYDSRHDERFWDIETMMRDGESLAVRGARKGADANALWQACFKRALPVHFVYRGRAADAGDQGLASGGPCGLPEPEPDDEGVVYQAFHN